MDGVSTEVAYSVALSFTLRSGEGEFKVDCKKMMKYSGDTAF